MHLEELLLVKNEEWNSMNLKKIFMMVALISTIVFISGCTQKQEAYVPTQTIIKALG